MDKVLPLLPFFTGDYVIDEAQPQSEAIPVIALRTQRPSRVYEIHRPTVYVMDGLGAGVAGAGGAAGR
jgi:hypothetical protein